jgi:hypothetical protein
MARYLHSRGNYTPAAIEKRTPAGQDSEAALPVAVSTTLRTGSIDDFALTRSVVSTLLGYELGPRVVELRHFALCDYYPMPDHSADVHFLDTKNNAGQRDS